MWIWTADNKPKHRSVTTKTHTLSKKQLKMCSERYMEPWKLYLDSQLHKNYDILMLAENNYLRKFSIHWFTGLYSSATKLSEWGGPSVCIAIFTNIDPDYPKRLHFLSSETLEIQ